MYRLPPIRRARDFRLYSFSGTRFLDLWQNQGRAYWGHTPRGLRNALKNRISPALFSPLPHPLYRKILKLVDVAFPGYVPRLFGSQAEAETALRAQGFDLPSGPWGRLTWTAKGAGHRTASLFRPDQPYHSGDVLCPILPLPSQFCGAMLLVKESSLLPETPHLPPFCLTGWFDVLSRLAGVKEPMKKPSTNEARMPTDFPYHFLGFDRHGRYLVPKLAGPEYFAFFKIARGQGILLNPSENEISILPAWASPGEWAAILRVLSSEAIHE